MIDHDSSEEDMPLQSMIPQAKGRLLKRFYEPLVLLHFLDPNYGEPIASSNLIQEESGDSQQALRRNFLKYLAYVCDYDTGGETVTALALEQAPKNIVYWLAANRDPRNKVIEFLRKILSDLRDLPRELTSHERRDKQQKFEETCVEFAIKRVKGYISRLQTQVGLCLKSLPKHPGKGTDVELALWLRPFQIKGPALDICRYCYDNRNDKRMNGLAARANSMEVQSKGVSYTKAFGLVRHYIGRLACHIRAAQIFIDAGLHLEWLFIGFRLEPLPSSKWMRVPWRAQSKLTLDGILHRMFSKDHPELKSYQDRLAVMDRKFDICRQLHEKFKNEKFKTRIHAELIVLDHFHNCGLQFFADDKFIGCSKPACYCCYQYLLHHQGVCLPATHHKTYLGWRPPDIADDSNTQKRWIAQRKIMNLMVDDIDRQVKQKISKGNGPSGWRPDSTTGITSSLGALVILEGDASSAVIYHGSVDHPDASDSEDDGSSYVTADEDIGSGSTSPKLSVEYDNDSDSELEGGVSLKASY